jgi:branched-subunit amino acid aminotransferase/4-amino-4-deoxychorismate lyase
MPATINVNGRITGERDAVISVFDHGFLYGEGIYETMRTYDGRLFLYERHMRRMRRSAGLISLAIPFTDGELATRIAETMTAAALKARPTFECWSRAASASSRTIRTRHRRRRW